MKQKWKKTASLALSAAMATGMLAGLIPAEASADQAEFFVSPEGSDKNDGSYRHPFATLEAARDAVREINDDMTGDIYVFIDGGNYYVDETIVFDEQDSGTNGHKIIYRNLDEVASASFIGGSRWIQSGNSSKMRALTQTSRIRRWEKSIKRMLEQTIYLIQFM